MRKAIMFSTLALSAALTAALCGGALAASAATTLSPTETKDLGGGLTYQYYDTTFASAPQKIFTASVNTSAADSKYEVVVHAVPGSSDGFTPSYVVDIAKDYEQRTGRKVYAGTNADFFAPKGSYVQPQQAFVQDGIVLWQGPNYGTGATKLSLGFDNKGHSVFGQLPVSNLDIVKVHAASGEELNLPVLLNPTTLEDGDVAIYSTVGTKTIAGAAKYVVTIDQGAISDKNAVGSTTRTVTGSVIDDKAVTIKSGQFAIVIKGENDTSRWFHEKFMYGSTITFEGKTAPSGVFEGMPQVVGGWADLMNAGEIISQTTLNTYVTDSGRSLTEKADRTFFGMKEDGTMVLVAVDGRGSNNSTGLTVMQEAQLAQEFGLYNAIELDGGGSTTMVIRENDQIVQKNTPSAGGKRKVCNAVLVVEKAEKTSEEETHTHTFGVWQTSETEHWKVCSCGEESSRGAHVFTDDIDATCNTCGYERTLSGGTSEPTEPAGPSDPAEPEKPAETKGGCFGSIALGGGVLLFAAVLGSVITVKKRR